jgi:PPM family protein phosphatase
MIKAVGLSCIGRVRQTNQDAYYLNDEDGVWLIADGMGGHNGGEVAASTATKLVPQWITQGHSVTEALHKLHDTVFDLGIITPELKGMGTTIIVAKYTNDVLQIFSVGDSRAYVIQANSIQQLTQDHSYVAQLVKQGLLNELQAQHHPKRHIVTQCIGGGRRQKPQIDFRQIELQPNQAILLCSDGLYNELNEQQILHIVQHADSSENAVQTLIREANKQGGKDNTTVVLLTEETYRRPTWKTKKTRSIELFKQLVFTKNF